MESGSSSKKRRHKHHKKRGVGHSTLPGDTSACSRTGSDCSPGNSSYISCEQNKYQTFPRAGMATAMGISEIDGVSLSKAPQKLHKWLDSLYNPKSAQNLLDVLEQPGTEHLLDTVAGEDGPLHYVVCQLRPDKEMMDILVTFLTYSNLCINSPGKDGMTPLHYAVQANNLASVRALLAFGADVNVVNALQHTVLDIATLLWLAHERTTKVSRRTNNLETVHEGKVRIRGQSFLNTTVSPKSSTLVRRASKKFTCRQGSTSSWEYISKENETSSSSENDVECGRTDENSEISLEDSREVISTMQPIRPSEMAVLDSPCHTGYNASLEDSRELTSTMQPIEPSEMAVLDSPCHTGYNASLEDPGLLKCINSILELLYSVHARSGRNLVKKFQKVPLLLSYSESDEFQSSMSAAVTNPFLESSDFGKSLKIKDFMEGKTVFSLYEELEFNINRCLDSQFSLSTSPDKAIALAMQQKELIQFKKTAKVGISFDVNGGSRLLFLDGGGIKGLVQIEVLRLLEEATGRKITELFDWIIGSSIGAIIALGLVYAKKSLKELGQLIFKLKDEVFANPRAGFAFNTKAMERMIMEHFGTDMHMCDVTRPKVLIAAVNKTHAPPKLHFFNNCFNDNFSSAPVWKVARYTSAAPIFFTEFEGYVDGGVLANNPCDYGLTAIQNFHRERHVNLTISMVVSVGTGIYPPEELGRIDAQEFLYFGKHWFSFSDTIKSRTRNLLSLLTNALLESEIVAMNCSVRCVEQNIPYYRFSPQLNHVIAAGEMDNEKLLEMMWMTRIQTHQQGLADLITLFQLVAEASKKNRYRCSRSHDLDSVQQCVV